MQELLNKIAGVVAERNLYREAWVTLCNCFGERMQDEELALMDSVLSSIKLDREEYELCIKQGAKTDTQG